MRNLDSRYLQILFLASFLIAGVCFLDFSIRWTSIMWVLTTGLSVQGIYIVALKLPAKTLLSATITSLSILLLFRARMDLYLCLGVVLAISSKFVFATIKKHYFNPANFGIVLLCLLGLPVWTSPAQWGTGPLLLFWIAALGITVVRHVHRYDVSLYFLGSYLLLLLMRVYYLGQPLSVFVHQFQSGALLLFTFFMISDPRSIPDHRTGRALFAVSVAVVTYILRFHYYQPNALLYALFLLSPITIGIDWVIPHPKFTWGRKKQNNEYSTV